MAQTPTYLDRNGNILLSRDTNSFSIADSINGKPSSFYGGTKEVLIIGYGGAGSKLAAVLAKDSSYHVTVLTALDYIEVSVNMSKVIATDGEEHKKALFDLIKEPGVTYEIGSAVTLTNHTCTTSSGKEIRFDACIVCTGVTSPNLMPDPVKEAKILDRQASIAEYQAKIRKAETIVIIGGGATGSEQAADIKLRNKNKRVILVHSGNHVLSSMSPMYSIAATEILKSHGVELRLNTKATGHTNNTVSLSDGSKIEKVDLVINSFPQGVNTKFMPQNALDDKGFVRVGNTFQSEVYPKIFALGDCANIDNVKTYPKIDDQLPTLVLNLKKYFFGHVMQPYKRGFMGKTTGPLFIALGHGHPDGVGIGPDLPGCGLFCWLCCLCGPPCSTPASKGLAKIKSDFNYTITPKAGKGISK